MTAHNPLLNGDLPLILVVDDEVRSQESMRRTLEEDFHVITASDSESARALLNRHAVSVILCDQRMPDESGVDFLKEVRERWPEVVRIVISGYADSSDIISGVNEAGIYQYILKPWTPDHLLQAVKSAVEASSLQSGLHRLELELRAGIPTLRERHQARQQQARSVFGFESMVRAAGSPLDALCDMASRVARHGLSVLLLGESGTGKELMARAIHYASPRLAGPFVVENCAAIPDALLESELFGHKRGAFTGAVEDHIGLFQRADGGTLFLDEIGETSPSFQVKLLRVLQEGELRPVGSTRSIPVDVRVLSATHRNLEDDVRAGRFREDLYYRLAGVTLSMPPLRERPGDIVPIAEHVLAAACQELGLPPTRFDKDVLQVLMGYPWPGNIRELRNEIARTLAMTDGVVLRAADFSGKLLMGQAGFSVAASALPASGSLQERLDAVEAMLLREVMLRLRWNKTKAAKELGISRVGLRAKLQRFGLEST
jgi:two-component system response regulator HupR/HoxA